MPGVDMTSDVKGWEQRFYVRIIVFFLGSLGRAGARKTRRVITLISVGGLPPSWPPSGACLRRATSGPVGLLTPPRVTPHRGGASSDGRWEPGQRWRQHAAVGRSQGSRAPAWPWPTGRHAMHGPGRRRRAAPCCLWPSAGERGCRAGPALSHGWPGWLQGAFPGAVGGADGPWPATGTPRRLRPAHDAHASCPLGSCGPGDAVPPATIPKA